MNLPPATLRLGTRASLLAKMQSQQIADLLIQTHPHIRIETILIKTTGDTVQNRPLYDIGGKGLFTKELELALLENRIDFAVHSFKDVPITMPLVDVSDLVVACVPPREDARDVLIGINEIKNLPIHARIGTSSLRRRCQLLDQRPDLDVQTIRGNIDTRLRKQQAGEFDAVILALAGLKRSGLYDEQRMTPIPLAQMLPAAGQGALALQCRADDSVTRQILQKINDPQAAICVELERQVVAKLNGDCHSAIAALAEIVHPDKLRLRVIQGHPAGLPPLQSADVLGPPHNLIDTAIETLLNST